MPDSVRLALLGLLLAVSVPDVAAQQFGRVDQLETNVTTYYHFLERGERSIQVSAIGAVRQPGLYEVGAGTDLRKLLLLTGGPTLDPRAARMDREVTIRLYRGGSARPIYESGFAEAASAAPGRAPLLQEGDVLYVEVAERERFNWRDGFTILGGLSAVAFIVQAVASLSN